MNKTLEALNEIKGYIKNFKDAYEDERSLILGENTFRYWRRLVEVVNDADENNLISKDIAQEYRTVLEELRRNNGDYYDNTMERIENLRKITDRALDEAEKKSNEHKLTAEDVKEPSQIVEDPKDKADRDKEKPLEAKIKESGRLSPADKVARWAEQRKEQKQSQENPFLHNTSEKTADKTKSFVWKKRDFKELFPHHYAPTEKRVEEPSRNMFGHLMKGNEAKKVEPRAEQKQSQENPFMRDIKKPNIFAPGQRRNSEQKATEDKDIRNPNPTMPKRDDVEIRHSAREVGRQPKYERLNPEVNHEINGPVNHEINHHNHLDVRQEEPKWQQDNTVRAPKVNYHVPQNTTPRTWKEGKEKVQNIDQKRQEERMAAMRRKLLGFENE